MRPEHLKVSHLSEIRWVSECGVGWWGWGGCAGGGAGPVNLGQTPTCAQDAGGFPPPLASRVEGEESGGGGGKGELRGGPLGRGRGRGKWVEKENKENNV